MKRAVTLADGRPAWTRGPDRTDMNRDRVERARARQREREKGTRYGQAR